ncbi:MAG: hypothetical protein WC967_13220 [Balneolaceae bacterium]
MNDQKKEKRLGDKNGRIYGVADEEEYNALIQSFGIRKVTEYPTKYPAVVFVSSHLDGNTSFIKVDIIGVDTLLSEFKKYGYLKKEETNNGQLDSGK